MIFYQMRLSAGTQVVSHFYCCNCKEKRSFSKIKQPRGLLLAWRQNFKLVRKFAFTSGIDAIVAAHVDYYSVTADKDK